MLSLFDTPIPDVSAQIIGRGYDVAFLVPTATGLNKSILDAHHALRAFLKRNGIHHYAKQRQGIKHYINAHCITAQGVIARKVSMYRPQTKQGDPRIWIYGLKAMAQPGNLLALTVKDGELWAFNCSRHADLTYALDNVLHTQQQQGLSTTAQELLQKLTAISQKGFISTVTDGDAGVGMTLEAQLGIAANSSQHPDYHGIEIKASRIEHNGQQRHRNQLFSKTPNWRLSPLGSAKVLIQKRGYTDQDGLAALRHTLSGASPNSRGLYLDIDYVNHYLRQMFQDQQGKSKPEHDMTWLLSDLKKALCKKHKETFWVKAAHNHNRAAETFHYQWVEHTTNPYVDRFETLLETGLITVDYTLHIKPTGGIRDHGYLFKLKENSLSALFPAAKKYDLTA